MKIVERCGIVINSPTLCSTSLTEDDLSYIDDRLELHAFHQNLQRPHDIEFHPMFSDETALSYRGWGLLT